MRGGAIGSSRWTRISRTVGLLVMKGMYDAAVLSKQKTMTPLMDCLVRCQIDNSHRSLILRPACRRLRSIISVASQAKALLASEPAAFGSAALRALRFPKFSNVRWYMFVSFRFDSRSWMRRAVALPLLGLAFTTPAFADGRDETVGVPPGNTLPDQAKGKGPPSWAGKAFRQGVVTTANPYAAEAGAKILEAGGNAVDAAAAIAYALNVVEPQSAGIGGGGFMMIHLASSGSTFAVDSRERAPALATPGMFVGKSFEPRPRRASPSAYRAWSAAPHWRSRARADLTLAQVIAPAIKLADEGFAATPRYVAASCSSRARNYPESEAYFCPGGVSRVAVGRIVQNQPLAETLAHDCRCRARTRSTPGTSPKASSKARSASGPLLRAPWRQYDARTIS